MSGALDRSASGRAARDTAFIHEHRRLHGRRRPARGGGAWPTRRWANTAATPHATVIGRDHKADALHACLINCLGIEHLLDTTTRTPRRWYILRVRSPPRRWRWQSDGRSNGADLLLAVALGIEIDVPTVEGDLGAAGARNRGVVADRHHCGHRCRGGGREAAATWMRHDCSTRSGLRCRRPPGFRVMHATMVSSLMPAQGATDRTARGAAGGARLHRLAGRAGRQVRLSWRSSPSSRIVTSLADGLGERFEILRNTYKPYPCGIVIHPIIDACLQLRREHAIDPASIDSVRDQGVARRDGAVRSTQSAATSCRHMSACITGPRRC